MGLYTLKIKDKEFKVGVISDLKEMKKGLSGKPAIGQDKGLLFNFGKEQKITMNMVGMNYPLDMIFINESREVIAVRSLPPGKFETTVTGARFVLEVNKGCGDGLVGELIECTPELAKAVGMTPCSHDEDSDDIEENDEEREESENKQDSNVNIIVTISSVPKKNKTLFKTGGTFKKYDEEVKTDKNAMQVLDHTGKVLMNIKGGERIFSIEHTEQLVALAKKVDKGEADSKELGILMDKIIQKQNTQEPQYV